MKAPKLELRNVRKEYGAFVAVERVDLAIAAGETLALLGPSGCGKSTTLNMIVGLDRPTSGDILIDGTSVVDRPPGERRIGLVFQDYAVFTHMSVRKNLAFGLDIKGRDRAETRRAVEEVSALLELTSLLDASPRALGGSELQRVAIGRTLVTNPAILLLDEPLSNLEAAMRHSMRQQLRKLQAETGQTIIYVTHDQVEALSLAHRIAVMSGGRVRQFDRTDVVYTEPAHTFVGSFLGSPPMNMVAGQFLSDGGRPTLKTADGEIFLPSCLAARLPEGGRRVVLGFRPEQVRLVQVSGDVLSATVALVERQGPQTIVTLSLDGAALVKALAPGHSPLAIGDRVGVAVEPRVLSVFDGESGVRLKPDPAAAAA